MPAGQRIARPAAGQYVRRVARGLTPGRRQRSCIRLINEQPFIGLLILLFLLVASFAKRSQNIQILQWASSRLQPQSAAPCRPTQSPNGRPTGVAISCSASTAKKRAAGQPSLSDCAASLAHIGDLAVILEPTPWTSKTQALRFSSHRFHCSVIVRKVWTSLLDPMCLPHNRTAINKAAVCAHGRGC